MRKFYSMKNLAIALVVALAMPATVQAEKGDILLKFSTVSTKDDKQRAYLDEIKVGRTLPTVSLPYLPRRATLRCMISLAEALQSLERACVSSTARRSYFNIGH